MKIVVIKQFILLRCRYVIPIMLNMHLANYSYTKWSIIEFILFRVLLPHMWVCSLEDICGSVMGEILFFIAFRSGKGALVIYIRGGDRRILL